MDKGLHVAIIPDGNGRWAELQNLPRSQGHKHGGDVIFNIIFQALNLGIKVLSLYTFSSDNWKRENSEVDFLMYLHELYFDKLKNFSEIEIIWAGSENKMPQKLIDAFLKYEKTKSIKKTKTRLTLIIYCNYSFQNDIVKIVKNIVNLCDKKELSKDLIDFNTIKKYSYISNLPDIDILIRTSGELRISNFDFLHMPYSELFFIDKKWPDFTVEDFRNIIKSFSERTRRYGDVVRKEK